MVPIIIKHYSPPQCGLSVIGKDIQSDYGQKVRCPNPATVLVQIEEDGNTMNLCDKCFAFLKSFSEVSFKKED